MDVISLSDGHGSTAKIAPALGFNCFDFQARVATETIPVRDAPPQGARGGEKPSGHGIPILFPFPNRIRGGRYSWNGKDYEIAPSHAPFHSANAIHGFCLDRPWRVAAREPNSVVGMFQLSRDAPDRMAYWPADFRIEVRYSVRGSMLR